MFKLKKLFTSRNIENCSVIVAIGLIVFFTIDMYMLSTIEGNAINFTPGPDTCPTCYNTVPVSYQKYLGPRTRHVSGRCYSWWYGWYDCTRHERYSAYQTLTRDEQRAVDNFEACCAQEHPCRLEKKQQCINNNCLTTGDQAGCSNTNCEALDPNACDFT